MYLKYSKTRDVKTPLRANFGDAIDVFVPNDFKGWNLGPNENICIPAGIKFEVPFGYALVVTNKSGIASKKSLVVGATLIDHGYAGEVHIDVHNIGHQDQRIEAGMKITQILMVPVMTPTLVEVPAETLYKDVLLVSGRGAGGFGSTGV